MAKDIHCSYYMECVEVAHSIKLPDALLDLDSKYNKCYCDDCHTKRGESYSLRDGPKPYNLYTKPVGWGRIMLHLPPRANHLDIFKEWNGAYHGTAPDKILRIVEGGELLFPGDETMHGYTLSEVDGHFNDDNKPDGFNTKKVFLSPSIKYAGCEVYAKKGKCLLSSGRSAHIRTVLQVRVKSGRFKVGPQTVGRTEPIDPPLSNDNIEWALSARNCVIPTAVLIQVVETLGQKDVKTLPRSLTLPDFQLHPSGQTRPNRRQPPPRPPAPSWLTRYKRPVPPLDKTHPNRQSSSQPPSSRGLTNPKREEPPPGQTPPKRQPPPRPPPPSILTRPKREQSSAAETRSNRQPCPPSSQGLTNPKRQTPPLGKTSLSLSSPALPPRGLTPEKIASFDQTVASLNRQPTSCPLPSGVLTRSGRQQSSPVETLSNRKPSPCQPSFRSLSSLNSGLASSTQPHHGPPSGICEDTLPGMSSPNRGRSFLEPPDLYQGKSLFGMTSPNRGTSFRNQTNPFKPTSLFGTTSTNRGISFLDQSHPYQHDQGESLSGTSRNRGTSFLDQSHPYQGESLFGTTSLNRGTPFLDQSHPYQGESLFGTTSPNRGTSFLDPPDPYQGESLFGTTSPNRGTSVPGPHAEPFGMTNTYRGVSFLDQTRPFLGMASPNLGTSVSNPYAEPFGMTSSNRGISFLDLADSYHEDDFIGRASPDCEISSLYLSEPYQDETSVGISSLVLEDSNSNSGVPALDGIHQDFYDEDTNLVYNDWDTDLVYNDYSYDDLPF